jgi:hypothetical protein
MSNESPDGRDSSGRFLKRAAEKAHDLHTVSEEGVHPMAKILFGWTETKHIGAMMFWGLGGLGAFLIMLDLFVHRHDYFSFANSTGFYGLYGFAAFTFVVLMGWPLGNLLRRDENYYGDAGGPPADVDPDLPEAESVAGPTYEGDD